MTDDTEAPMIPGGRGGLIRPWQPGQSGNPKGMSHAKREAHRLARLAAPDAVALLIERMSDPAEDARVRIVAAGAVLDRGLGKAKDEPPEDDSKAAPDLSHLTEAELIEVQAIIARLRELTGRGLAPVPLVQIYLPDNGRDRP